MQHPKIARCCGWLAPALVLAMQLAGPSAWAQTVADGAYFQFRATVPDCPAPAQPVASTPSSGQALPQDAAITSALRAALAQNQLYTHSPLVNSSLWAQVRQRVVTIAGCVAGDVPPGYDHALIRTQFEKLAMSLPGVEKAVVLIRTGAQARAGEAVPYPTLAQSTAADKGPDPRIDPGKTSQNIRNTAPLKATSRHPLAGFWETACGSEFGLAIAATDSDLYSVSFCGPGACYKPGTFAPNTPIRGDTNYRVDGPNTLSVKTKDDKFNVHTRCTPAG